MHRSLKAGRRVKLDQVGLFADGVAVKQVGAETFRLCSELVDDVIACRHGRDVRGDQGRVRGHARDPRARGRARHRGRESVCRSVRGIRDETLVAIASGANMNFDRLRFVAEEAELGEAREAIIAVTIPEKPGELQNVLRAHRPAQHHRVQLSLRRSRSQAHVFVGVQVRDRQETQALVEALQAAASTRSISPTTSSPSCTSAISSAAMRRRSSDEILYRFEFPERPGALMRFPERHERRLEHQPFPLP